MDKKIIIIFLLVIVFYIMLSEYLNKTNVVTFYVEPSSLDPEFAVQVRDIIFTSDIATKYKLKELYEVTESDPADITIRLVPREQMIKHYSKIEYYPGTNKQIWFSFTMQRPKPHIAIDGTNWLYGVPESGLNLSDYRKYVILHEFMHGLGYDHQPCNVDTAINGVCPILYQATRGPPKGFKSGTAVFPVDYTKKLNLI